MKRDRKGLRKGFTTGTAAAAAARAAAAALFSDERPPVVPVKLPSGDVLDIEIKSIEMAANAAEATVIKDAGDDPDVTDGAEISVEVVSISDTAPGLAVVTVEGGEGVGRVTRPGLAVPVGRPAINPVPEKMIRNNLLEVFSALGVTPSVIATVSVPRGRRLARKTMNERLGVLGGISILGTTGIVEPYSVDAYTEYIKTALNVASRLGLTDIVLSTGRSSEKAIQKFIKLKQPAYVLVADNMGFALKEAVRGGVVKTVVIAAQFGKFTKLAAGRFNTHSGKSSVDIKFLARVIEGAGAQEDVLKRVLEMKTAREVFSLLKAEGLYDAFDPFLDLVVEKAERYAGGGLKVSPVLVGYSGEIVGKVVLR